MTHVFEKRIMTDDDRNEILSLADKIWPNSHSWENFLFNTPVKFNIYCCSLCNIKILETTKKFVNYYTVDVTIHYKNLDIDQIIENNNFTCDEWIIKNIIE